ncbi:DNA repair protein [gamma proteobacterium HdN1]|nr:DNA repair protein [gamma proteobacterium HdN1]
MSKSKTKARYSCTECGSIVAKWAGQCADCGAWNTMVESVPDAAISNPRRGGWTGAAQTVTRLSDVSIAHEPRIATGLTELDRVLGGGLVDGSVVLIGGDPGIGKSTLLLQTLTHLAELEGALYVTGEESLQQVALRARRLELPMQRLDLMAETSIENILATAAQEKPKVMVVDSIQTVFTETLSSAPGGVSQVRECAAALVRFAKQTGTALFLVGHVTKEGALAGPRVLEHMVDCVLYFEGEQDSRFRIIRAVKNRFGAVNELGVFAMTDRGLREIANPSAIFLSRYGGPIPGSIVMVTRDGSRPLLVEVQALVDDSQFGQPRRVAVGLDQNRLAMLLAVLNRHGGVATMGMDVFMNVVGGVKVLETGSDLAVLLSVTSSLRSLALDSRLIAFGEVGLSGEIRPVPNGQERLREAAKHGFQRAIVPKANLPKGPIEGMDVVGVTHLAEALQAI